MVEHNWDTNETFLWIANAEEYYLRLKKTIGNELAFISQLYEIILEINNGLGVLNQINSAEVNGNELYIRFSELCGNEQEGWK